MSVDSTHEHGMMLLKLNFEDDEYKSKERQAIKVAGMMEKQGESSFMKNPSIHPLGSSVNVSRQSFKEMLDR